MKKSEYEAMVANGFSPTTLAEEAGVKWDPEEPADPLADLRYESVGEGELYLGAGHGGGSALVVKGGAGKAIDYSERMLGDDLALLYAMARAYNEKVRRERAGGGAERKPGHWGIVRGLSWEEDGHLRVGQELLDKAMYHSDWAIPEGLHALMPEMVRRYNGWARLDQILEDWLEGRKRRVPSAVSTLEAFEEVLRGV
jgi:hypothetical protein